MSSKNSKSKPMAFSFFGIILLVIGFALVKCSKTIKNEPLLPNRQHSISVKEYVEKAKKEHLYSQRTATSNKFSGSYYIDWRTTRQYPISIGDTIYNRFLTGIRPSINSSDTIGYVIGYVLHDGQKVFNVIGIKEGPDRNGTTLVHVKSLDGDELGTYSVNNNRVTNVTYEEGPEMDEYSSIRRSWFRCTMDCIDDASYACMGDGTCHVLLIASNSMPIAPGAGSVSIAAACMAACTKNRNLDLLPNH